MRFDGKTAFIPGGTSGMGLTTAEKILQEGGRVVVAGRDEQKGADAIERLRPHGSTDFVSVDVKDPESLKVAVDDGKAALGGQIDILICSAGELYFAPALEPNYDELMAMVKTNFIAPALLVSLVAPEMIDRGWGKVVNVTTLSTLRAFPMIGGYAASKAATGSYTQFCAVELAASGVNVNAIAPGPVPTPMGETFREGQEQMAAALPSKRKGTEEEMAEGIMYLASDAASYVHGITLFIDGGFSANYC